MAPSGATKTNTHETQNDAEIINKNPFSTIVSKILGYLEKQATKNAGQNHTYSKW